MKAFAAMLRFLVGEGKLFSWFPFKLTAFLGVRTKKTEPMDDRSRGLLRGAVVHRVHPGQWDRGEHNAGQVPGRRPV